MRWQWQLETQLKREGRNTSIIHSVARPERETSPLAWHRQSRRSPGPLSITSWRLLQGFYWWQCCDCVCSALTLASWGIVPAWCLMLLQGFLLLPGKQSAAPELLKTGVWCLWVINVSISRTGVWIFSWFQCYLDHVALTCNLERSHLLLMKKPVLNIFFLKAEHCNIQAIIWFLCVLYLKDLYCIHLHQLDAFHYWVLHELGIFRGQPAVHPRLFSISFL